MHFQPPVASVSLLLKLLNILKFNDMVNLQNFLYAHDSLKDALPTALRGKIDVLDHTHDTRLLAANVQLTRPSSNTVLYGSKSINNRAIEIWNSINNINPTIKFYDKSRAVCKLLVKKMLLSKY